MVVSVTASTTQGQVLSDPELEAVIEACDMAIELVDFKTKILTYVESRMSYIAPNLSLIVGASVAAKLMGKDLSFVFFFFVFDSLSLFLLLILFSHSIIRGTPSVLLPKQISNMKESNFLRGYWKPIQRVY